MRKLNKSKIYCVMLRFYIWLKLAACFYGDRNKNISVLVYLYFWDIEKKCVYIPFYEHLFSSYYVAILFNYIPRRYWVP